MTDLRKQAGIYGPVTDWAADFDHADPEYNEHIHEIWDDLRERCPVAHTDRYNGAWLPLSHADVTAIAYDTEHFTSRSVIVNTNVQLAQAPIGGAPPITSDPPFHHDARRLLLPPFAPKQIDPWEDDVRSLCNELIDAMGDADVVDAAAHYAQHIPVNVIARMLGFPVEDADMFRGFVHNVLEAVNLAPGARIGAFEALDAYITRQVEEHIADPRDDLTTYLLNAKIFDQPLSPQHVTGTIVLLLVAGIDTTWSAIGSSLWHLAQDRDDLARLGNEPDLWPTAIEEFLRAYAPVTMARMVAKDVEVNGCPMKVDDWVLLPFPAANRDPQAFDRADEVLIDREENRHLAFGLGIHRCLGSNLARLELRVAVETFVERFPEFELADPSAVRWSVGQVRGPRELPVRILRRA
ncbi:MAG: cytochrome P450 [Ilumatobacteraceae bacterium]